MDTQRALNPDDEIFTYRKKLKEVTLLGRLDYSLASKELFKHVISTETLDTPPSISDHNAIKTTICIENFEEGPGTFRANPHIEDDHAYAASARHLINQELVELTSLPREEKIKETILNNEILSLTLKMNSNQSTLDEQAQQGIKTSTQRTKAELLQLETEIPKHKLLDYIIHKVGRATKTYQSEKKKLQNNTIMDLSDKLGKARAEEENEKEILELEQEMDSTLETICLAERAKMKTFSMLQDERPTRHMIQQDKQSKPRLYSP